MKEMCKKERTQNEDTLVKTVRSIFLLYATAIAPNKFDQIAKL